MLAAIALLLGVTAARPVAHASPADAPQSLPGAPSGSSVIVPTPEPFSLNAYDAVQALWMIRRARLLQQRLPHGELRTLAVREVRAVLVDVDPEAPTEALSRRYDLVVNGELLDWDNSYIEYGGRMVSVRLLFTYRNQHPPPGLLYHLPTDHTGSGASSGGLP